MRAEEIMNTDVIRVSPETLVKEAADIMAEKDISGAPVVDENGRLVGILSESDLIQARRIPAWLSYWVNLDDLGPAGGALAAQTDDFLETLKEHLKRPVSEVMTRKVWTVSPQAPVEDVVKLMTSRRINRVPVVEDGRLLGIITRGDVLEAMRGWGTAPYETE